MTFALPAFWHFVGKTRLVYCQFGEDETEGPLHVFRVLFGNQQHCRDSVYGADFLRDPHTIKVATPQSWRDGQEGWAAQAALAFPQQCGEEVTTPKKILERK